MINNIPIAGCDGAATAAAAAAFVQNLNFNTELNLENERTVGSGFCVRTRPNSGFQSEWITKPILLKYMHTLTTTPKTVCLPACPVSVLFRKRPQSNLRLTTTSHSQIKQESLCEIVSFRVRRWASIHTFDERRLTLSHHRCTVWNWILNWSFPYFDNLLYIITHINYE